LKQLGNLPGLREVTLLDTGPVTAPGIKELARAPITYLAIGGAPNSARAPLSDDVVEAIAGMTELAELHFAASHVPSDAALAKFHAAMPKCRIVIGGKIYDPKKP
jgi:hypothetical protein